MIQAVTIADIVQSMLHGPIPSTSERTRLMELPEIARRLPIRVEVPDEYQDDPRVIDGILSLGIIGAWPEHHHRTSEENLEAAINAIRSADITTIGASISRQCWGNNYD